MKKKHFYEGMKPSPSDFDVLQQNTEDEIRAVTGAITGVGVMSGLDVTLTGKPATHITVTKGHAIAPDGSLLVVPSNTTIGWNRNLNDSFVVLRSEIYTTATTKNIRQKDVWETNNTRALVVHVDDNTYTASTNEIILARAWRDHARVEYDGILHGFPYRHKATGWDTVAALRQQMKQELTTKIEQVKTELTSAVAQARSDADTASRALRGNLNTDVVAINRSISSARSDATSAISSARRDATSAINTAKTEAINAALPIGFIYVQFPAQKTPAQLSWPGTWQDISTTYEGCFFRAETITGNNVSKPFTNIVSRRRPYSDPRAPQPDAGRETGGSFGIDNGTGYLPTGSFYSGVNTIKDAHTGGGSGQGRKISFWASNSWGNIHTSSEFRPINYTIRIWKRTP